MQLTNAEEQVMKYLWKLGRGYLKNIIDEFPEPRPAATTVATLIKRMIDKGFVGYNQHGTNREYFPNIRKSDYFAGNINLIIKDFFNDSASQFASFFTNETNLSLSELEELKALVEKKIATKKK
jgi:BlaI family transcriptional regulator, penicillinase repressor